MCFDNDEGKTTPTEFATTPDSGLTLITLERAATAKAAEEKRYTLAMNNKPWKEVIDWFADVSGLRYAGRKRPPGRSRSTPPRTSNTPSRRSWTLSTTRSWPTRRLPTSSYGGRGSRRRGRSPSSRRTRSCLPPSRINLEDLDKFGRTEIVWVELRPKGGHSTEVMAILRKHHSPWGSATSIPGGRRLSLIDTTAAVRDIIKAMKESDLLQTEGQAEGRAWLKELESDCAVAGSGSCLLAGWPGNEHLS